jgi:hypothetical protein
MSSYREMDAIGRDRPKFVLMAKQCLLFPDLAEREKRFLQDLISGNEMMGGAPVQLSTRQAEWLFGIRDEHELHTKLYGGFSVVSLIQRVYEARLDLSEADEDWIVKIWSRRPVVDRLRRRDIAILRRCAIQIGAIESYMDDVA